ncbi:hypothetical protein DFH09DRAFT_898399, partial [Mycena vulgaris]
LFGAIHCAAWKSKFVFDAEMWIWRICSIQATLILFASSHLLPILNKKEKTWAKAVATMIRLCLPLLLIYYMFSRGALVVLPLAAMRSLPPGALMDVRWVSLLPFL